MGTYLEESRTFRGNSSTKVLQKEEEAVWRRSGKALIGKKNREMSQIEARERVWYQIETEGEELSTGENLKRFSH